jgi:methionyl-tRNA formyltransferase
VTDIPSTTPSGTVLRADEQLVIATGSGGLRIYELQPAGKRMLSTEDFLHGHRVQVGERFGEIGTE